MKSFCNIGDCKIVRESTPFGSCALLLDEEGQELARFDAGTHDCDILDVLRFANYAFDRGVTRGAIAKQYEIRKALGL
ncbi:MAG TPA: hypothetical protein VFQ88_12310 [Nevskiaceae bacterium]|nr:hypothetical protein [Nevskiaceae bacterium]